MQQANNNAGGLGHRTSSLEMLNNAAEFEEKRAFIASTLSLNDLLKPGAIGQVAGDYRGHHQVGGQPSQFSPGHVVSNSYGGVTAIHNGYQGQHTGVGIGNSGQPNNSYLLPQSLLKPNTNGYNVNFLNNGVPDKDLGKKSTGVVTGRSNSLGTITGTATPPVQRRSRFHAFGRLFKPWKWKRRRKSEKFEATSKSLERKISVRTSKEELISRGILLPLENGNPLSANFQNLATVKEETASSPKLLPHQTNNNKTEPNKEKTEHSNGSVPTSGDGGVVNHSPKSCGSLMSPAGGAPPGSVPLPGMTGHGRHERQHSSNDTNGGVCVTVSNGNSAYSSSSDPSRGQGRGMFSPDSDSSPPTPNPPPAPETSTHHLHRPVSLKSVKADREHQTGKSDRNSGTGGSGKRTRWLLCYHMGGGAPSASPSPPSEQGHSQCSTPSPTDHGFKLPNSFSNERPTSLPVALLNCSGSGSISGSETGPQSLGQGSLLRGVAVNEAVNPLSIDPNERVTPLSNNNHEQHNGDLMSLPHHMESIGVTDIGVIPPPPMFSSPSPPSRSHILIPPPKEHQSDSRSNQSHSRDQQMTVGNHNARGHDHQGPEIYSDDEEEEEVEEEHDDDFIDLPPGIARIVTTVPAKEPRLEAVPIKSALKKPHSASTPTSQNGRHHAASPAQEKSQSSSLGGGRRPPQFSGLREDKENIPHSDDDEDGPILYRDDEMEDEDRLAERLARKESLSQKLQQRPGKQELIDRNILYQMSDDERKIDRTIIGAKLIRRLSLRPTPEELEDRNILKRKDDDQIRADREEKKRYLLRKLSFRPSVDELKNKKIIKFNDYIEVTPCHEYDRRADKPWTRLTPKDKANIRKELNDFKSAEMDVHDESRHLTRFHRP